LADSERIMNAHRYYLEVCSWDLSLKAKIGVVSKIIESAYDDHWRVVGVTEEAVKIFALHDFKRKSRMGVNRGHKTERKQTLTTMIERPFEDAAKWWQFFYENDETILMTSSENKRNEWSREFGVPSGLFRTSGFGWKHGREETQFLVGLFERLR